jgi:hypothetical protein
VAFSGSLLDLDPRMAHCPISMMVTFDQLFVGNGPIVFGRLLVMTHAFLRFGVPAALGVRAGDDDEPAGEKVIIR